MMNRDIAILVGSILAAMGIFMAVIILDTPSEVNQHKARIDTLKAHCVDRDFYNQNFELCYSVKVEPTN